MPTESVSNSVSRANTGTSFTLALSARGPLASPLPCVCMGVVVCVCLCWGHVLHFPADSGIHASPLAPVCYWTALAGGVQICTGGLCAELGPPTGSVDTVGQPKIFLSFAA